MTWGAEISSSENSATGSSSNEESDAISFSLYIREKSGMIKGVNVQHRKIFIVTRKK